MSHGPTTATKQDIQDFAYKAYNDLGGCGYPEFGEEVRMAIIDTAGDALCDAGFNFDREYLVAYAKELAG